jgi:hypothetical protein
MGAKGYSRDLRFDFAVRGVDDLEIGIASPRFARLSGGDFFARMGASTHPRLFLFLHMCGVACARCGSMLNFRL